jgi:hypothetical protein
MRADGTEEKEGVCSSFYSKKIPCFSQQTLLAYTYTTERETYCIYPLATVGMYLWLFIVSKDLCRNSIYNELRSYVQTTRKCAVHHSGWCRKQEHISVEVSSTVEGNGYFTDHVRQGQGFDIYNTKSCSFKFSSSVFCLWSTYNVTTYNFQWCTSWSTIAS